MSYIKYFINHQQWEFMTTNTSEGTPTEEPVKNSAEDNLVKLRKLFIEEKAEKEELKANYERLLNESKAKKSVVEDDDDEDEDEPYLDRRTFKKKMNSMRDEFSSLIDEKAEQKARFLLDQEKKDNYLKTNADFNEVLSEDVINRFADKHPGVADAILRMPDSFERQKLVYEAIKATGTHKKEEKASIQDKINENKKNLYYIPNTAGSAPYNGVGDFSEQGQKQAYDKLKELKSRLRL